MILTKLCEQMRKNSHSKMSKLVYSELKMQTYVKSKELSLTLKRTLFAYRLRMLEFGENFRGQRPSVPCPFQCTDELDNQLHLYTCKVTSKILSESDVKHEDFLTEEVDTEKVKILEKALNRRKQTIESECPNFKVFG